MAAFIAAHLWQPHMSDNYTGPNGALLLRILGAVLACHVAEVLWNCYVDRRQLRVVRRTTAVPQLLTDFVAPDTFDRARAYALDRLCFGLLRSTVMSLLITSAEIWWLALPLQWQLARWICANWLGREQPGETLHSCVFVAVISAVGTLKSLPWSYYSTFVVEQRHGFNKQTRRFFVWDQLKGVVVAQAITQPIVCAVVWIVRAGGPLFFVWLWLFAVVVVLFLLTVYPIFIAPLFDKYEELRVGPLRTKIEELAARLRFPLTQLYVVEGSKRSAHSNAYFYGLWNSKRIVLFDTLLAGYAQPEKAEEAAAEPSADGDSTPTAPPKGCSDDEVVAVLGHELGHWQRNHITKNILISQVHMLLVFALFGYLVDNRLLYQAFGFEGAAAEGGRPVIVGLLLLGNYILTVFNWALGFASTVLSRRFEYEADEFAVQLGYAEPLQRALVKLNADNLSFPMYDWLYSTVNHSHPPLLHRLARMEQVAAAAKKRAE